MWSDFTIHWGIAPEMYRIIFDILVSAFVLVIFAKNVSVSGNAYLLQKQPQLPMTLFVTFMILFIGFRVVNSGDMGSYRGWYLYRMNSNGEFSWSSEWLWEYFALICKKAGFSEWIWFAFITFGYIGCMFWTCRKLLFENVTLAMLFMFSSFSFFSYGTNTLRNGLACAIVLLAIGFIADGKKNRWIVVTLLLAAFGIHRSTIVPISSIVLALYVIKKPKYAIYVWFVCILLSAIGGDRFSSLFSGIDFDERFKSYYTNAVTADQALFSHTGFRWDFLLYSSVPVVVTWIATETKGIKDKMFDVISTVYVLSNSVWVLCIRANYSDRFAYLSWFLYPLVLAYAFIRLPMYKNQDSAVAWVLLTHVGFTMFMAYIYGK